MADLEDAVAPAEKAAARELVARLLAEPAPPAARPSPHPGRGVDPLPSRSTISRKRAPDRARSAAILGRPLRVVRVNGVETEWFQADVEMTRDVTTDALVLPKAAPDAVAALGEDGPPVIAIIETAEGARQAYAIATAPRVVALVLGAVDLGVELGLEPRPDGLEILYARSKVVLDSAAAGIRPPFDVVHLDVRDDEGLEEECRLARSLGFRGKACIHPAQVPIVHRVFAPSEAEVEWARRVIEAYTQAESEGHGVLALNGAMVDLPVVERARRVLAEAERSSA